MDQLFFRKSQIQKIEFDSQDSGLFKNQISFMISLKINFASFGKTFVLSIIEHYFRDIVLDFTVL